MSKRKHRRHARGNQPVDSGFKEVDLRIYLSWPWDIQLQYCAMRDMDSAEKAQTEDEAEWFRNRAQSFLQELANGQRLYAERAKGKSEEGKGA